MSATALADASARSPSAAALASAWVSLLRPRQWLKNAFVFAPLLFTKSAHDWPSLQRATWCFAAFCLLASAVYALNDARDAQSDRSHPRKRRRPIAVGAISARAGVWASLVLAGCGLSLAACLGTSSAVFAALYLANSLLYCFWFKYRVLVDALAIAIGFLLRLLAGCAAIAVEPSSWLIVCGFSMALFLAFGKRRLEIAGLSAAEEYRGVLGVYSIAKLDAVLAITCAVSLLSYMLYATAPDTIARHGTKHLVYTSVFVFYGLFRYLFKVLEGKGDGPTDVLVRDPVFLLNGLLWASAVFAILRFSL